jgi:SAM-dependent methyltransferase
VSEVRIFTPEYYRALHDIERRHPWARAMRRLEIALAGRYLDTKAEIRTLDAGCGAGVFLAELTALRPGVEPYGGDLSRHALRLAMQTGHRRIAELDVRRLPMPDASFDLVISNDVLQHLGRDGAAEALREAARVLGPGGLLVVRTAARRGLLWRRHRDTRDYCQWRRGQLRRLLVEAGFEPRFIARVNWLPSLVADLRGRQPPRPVGHRAAARRANVEGASAGDLLALGAAAAVPSAAASAAGAQLGGSGAQARVPYTPPRRGRFRARAKCRRRVMVLVSNPAALQRLDGRQNRG